jgi:hypothetical protein
VAHIRTIDMLVVEDVFEMGGGYVLDFSNRTFAQFFAAELDVDIDDTAYARIGTSKANRLRCFLQTVDAPTAARTLGALWEYREALREKSGKPDPAVNSHSRLAAVIGRLGGRSQVMPQAGVATAPALDRAVYSQFLIELQNLTNLAPHPRGYAFESFLKRLFDKFGLEARDPFRLTGEQIDGSFLLGNETYLLEGKWQNAPSSIEHLHTFHGKVEQKAAWTRGLFVSYSGFSEGGLVAFGRGKRVVCMEGYDLAEAFMRELPLSQVLERKVRRAAETGAAFVRVRDLF